MDSKKLNYVLIALLIIAFLVIALLVYANFKISTRDFSSNDISNSLPQKDNILDSESNKESIMDSEPVTDSNLEHNQSASYSKPSQDSNPTIAEKPSSNTNNNSSTSVNTPTETPSHSEVIIDNEDSKPVEYSSKDKNVIASFNSLSENVDTMLVNSSSDSSIKDKAKGVFISIVDFLFYDGEINGIKFQELTDNGKAKILEIAAKIDEKIESKFPGYKENISNKTTSTFNSASELIKKGAKNFDDFAKSKLSDVEYQNYIDSKQELTTYVKTAGTLIKDFSTSAWEKIKDFFKEWYENFRNN